jgi:hypothetical protein
MRFLREEWLKMSEIANTALSALATLAGAFVGAWAAFRLEERRRQREKADQNVVAGNLALLTLSDIWNVLVQYQKEVVNEWRGRRDAWLNLPVANFDHREVTFDTQALSFLLEDYPAQLQTLLLERRRFDLAVRMVQDHSQLMLREVFPRLSAVGIKLNEGRPESDIRKILGVGTVRQLEVLTAAIVKNIDEDVTSSRRAFDDLRASLKAIYPKRRFIDLPKP